MKLRHSQIEGVFLVEPELKTDERGWFARVFCSDELKSIGFSAPILQINHSYNEKKHTFRGLHFQEPPYAEVKLVRCITGEVCDVVLDLRKDSPTFLKHELFELSVENRQMLVIPKGLAHGFLTMADKTELLYHHTVAYRPESERGIRFDDPAIRLVLPAAPVSVSAKDQSYALLSDNFKGWEV